MFVRKVVILVAATALVIGALCGDARAQSSDDASAKALEIIRKALQCPLPFKSSKTNLRINAGIVRFEDVTQRINRFSGTKTHFSIDEESAVSGKSYYPNGMMIPIGYVSVDRISANWHDIDEVSNYKDGEVAIRCKDKQKCITWQNFNPVAHTKGGILHQDIEVVNLCDAETATNVRTAFEFLIKLNGGRVGQLYKVRNDVSTGVLNMRTEPNANSSLVVAVPGGTPNVLVNRCRKFQGSIAPWCEAEWQGNKGWISGCCMVNAKTGKSVTKEKNTAD